MTYNFKKIYNFVLMSELISNKLFSYWRISLIVY